MKGQLKARQRESRIVLLTITPYCLCAEGLGFHGIHKDERLKGFTLGNNKISLYCRKMTNSSVEDGLQKVKQRLLAGDVHAKDAEDRI